MASAARRRALSLAASPFSGGPLPAAPAPCLSGLLGGWVQERGQRGDAAAAGPPLVPQVPTLWSPLLPWRTKRKPERIAGLFVPRNGALSPAAAAAAAAAPAAGNNLRSFASSTIAATPGPDALGATEAVLKVRL
eukprot:66654-Chlamydomonas_euryale.AAC.3